MRLAVLAAPDDQGDKEGDEADGCDDHGQEHIFGRVQVHWVLQGAVVEVAVVALEDVLLRQCVGVAVVQAFSPELQAAPQLAVGPGKRSGHRHKMGHQRHRAQISTALLDCPAPALCCPIPDDDFPLAQVRCPHIPHQVDEVSPALQCEVGVIPVCEERC